MISAIRHITTIQPTTLNTRKTTPLRPFAYDSVSFTSKNLLTKSSDEITEVVKAAISDGRNYIGKGTKGEVYKIPDTKYCVKLRYDNGTDFGEWDKLIYPNQQVNHIVAKAENKAVIMKHIEGESLHWGREPREIYNLPPQSYKNLLKQLSEAHKRYMVFDDAQTNIIYNPKDKSLTAIDFYDENSIRPRDFTPITDVFTCLMAKGNSDEDKSVNRQLCGKLMNLVVDELSSGKRQEFYIGKQDVIDTLEKLQWSQVEDTHPHYESLEKAMGQLIDLKYSPDKTETQIRRFEWETKYTKILIDKMLSD